ncbi:YceH family protein [Methylibium petroleiphilum]|uniref:YceH family protein n=1 Tax=Methylibium petroleiphilum TaxID=105560 RepID=UPI001ACD2085|nr:YceH family protein [Methylibium petroleiphilum]MBN9203085.1 YceH family protein [Methylibium petroleiphilum]
MDSASDPADRRPARAALRVLSLIEQRVVAVLVEKQHTVSDSYPLSLNALVLGCNQKTAREPVIAATESEVLEAVDELKRLSLVIEVSGSRVARYEHNLQRVLGVPSQAAAILTLLMLRGPQTAAELRANTERLHRFADISSVEGFLDELALREPPLVVKLPRAPGSREARWAQLLGGAPDVAATAPAGGAPEDLVTAGEIQALRANQHRLQSEVVMLRAQLHRLAAELGVDLS